MQWFRQKAVEDPGEFWRGVESRRGGKVRFLTFATLLGRSDGTRVDLPGLLYVVDDTIWFEDFEKDNWLARLFASHRAFEKTEISIAMGEVAGVRMVTRMAAARCLAGAARPAALRAASPLRQRFSVTVAELLLRNGSAVFFDVIKRAEFAALFAEENR
jgi:hypothetical protein